MLGKKYNMLTVVDDKRVNGKIKCKCDCGNIKYIRPDHLISGNTKSCGCYRKKRKPSNFKDLTGKRFGKLTVLKQSNKTSKHGAVWELKCDCGNTSTAVTSDLTSGKIKTCGCSWSEAGNKVQKWKENDKIDGVFVPMLTKNSPTGASGVKGVRRRVRKNGTVRWQAHIGIKNKDIYLGSFKTIEEATKARKEAEEKYYKPYIKEYKAKKDDKNEDD